MALPGNVFQTAPFQRIWAPSPERPCLYILSAEWPFFCRSQKPILVLLSARFERHHSPFNSERKRHAK